MTDTATEIRYIKETVDEIKEILVGNGDPAKGVVVRLTRLEDSVKTCQTMRDSREAQRKEERKSCTARRMTIYCAVASFLTALTLEAIRHWWK